MNAIISLAAVVSFLSLAVFHVLKNRRSESYVSDRARLMPRILCLAAIMISCGILCDDGLLARMLSDMVLAVTAILMLVVSLVPPSTVYKNVYVISCMMLMFSIYYLLCVFRVLPMLSERFFLMSAFCVCVMALLQFLWSIWRRLRDVKTVVQSGNVWSFVCLCVDSVHVILLPMVLLVLISLIILFPHAMHVFITLAVLCLIMEVAALSLRVSYDSVFVLLHDHERIIVESMKISHMDATAGHDSKDNDVYKELYERILFYFESSRPYLDGDLTINDVVKVVYSNKVYISKAIFRFTGRNFRQFVNYHRVMYSVESFRSSPELKVSELAQMSGFNNQVSYTMAFRLFMNETPSEWCHKERSRILKQKK